MSKHSGGFQVDLTGVRDFGAGLRADLDGHLSVETEQVTLAFIDTPSFGSGASSADVQAAATLYHQQLIKLLDLMDTFVHNGAVMVQAAEDVVEAYRTVDTLSGDAFRQTLETAAAKVSAAAWQAGHDPRTGRQA